jgi:hypothetical protein
MLTIHADSHNPSHAPKWHVMVDPMTTGRHDLVRFVKWGQQSKLLDRVAEWADGGWLPTRWVPQSPQVPVGVLKIAEAWMRGEVDQ